MASAGLLAGIGQGLQNAATGGLHAYRAIRSDQRADLLTALQQQLLNAKLQDIAEKRAAIQNMPANLAVIGGALNPQPGPAQIVQMPLQAVAPGVDTPLPPSTGGTGLLAAIPSTVTVPPEEGMTAVVPPAAAPPSDLTVTIPGATPQRPRTTAELFAQPGATQAYTGLLRAGINPLGKGGVFLRPEDYAQQIQAEENKKQGLADLNTAAGEYANATDRKGRISGILKIFSAEAKANGKVGDTGAIMRALGDEQELAAFDQSATAMQPITAKILDGTATPADVAQGIEIVSRSKSAGFKGAFAPFVQQYVTGMPGLAANQRFYEITAETPSMPKQQAWGQVRQEMGRNAALAEQQNHLPPELKAEIQAQAAGAAEAARNANMSPLGTVPGTGEVVSGGIR